VPSRSDPRSSMGGMLRGLWLVGIADIFGVIVTATLPFLNGPRQVYPSHSFGSSAFDSWVYVTTQSTAPPWTLTEGNDTEQSHVDQPSEAPSHVRADPASDGDTAMLEGKGTVMPFSWNLTGGFARPSTSAYCTFWPGGIVARCSRVLSARSGTMVTGIGAEGSTVNDKLEIEITDMD
jgi:hypothetical protein